MYAKLCLFYTGDVFLHSIAVKCGGEIYCSCLANKTNAVSISASRENTSYGTHTFERGSHRQVSLGPLELYVVKAEKDPDFIFLTNFEIRMEHNSRELLNISCFDVSMKMELQAPTEFESMCVCSQSLH